MAASSGTNVYFSSSGAAAPQQIIFKCNKFILKQETAINDGIAGGYSNLNQLRNGLLEYTAGGGKVYPHFYGGLPLYTFDQDYQVSFDINVGKLNSTNQYYRVWIKSEEFKNQVVPDSAELDDCVELKLSTTAGAGSKYIDLPLAETKKLTFEAKKGKTYFLKYQELDNSMNSPLGEGGKVNYLSNLLMVTDAS